MKTILQQEKTETRLERHKSQENFCIETRLFDVISRYFIWFTNNNVEEFQTFSKFWNHMLLNQTSLFETNRKFN